MIKVFLGKKVDTLIDSIQISWREYQRTLIHSRLVTLHPSLLCTVQSRTNDNFLLRVVNRDDREKGSDVYSTSVLPSPEISGFRP